MQLSFALERFFGDLSEQAISSGGFESVPQLAKRIEAYIAGHNPEPKRYVWKAEGADPKRELA